MELQVHCQLLNTANLLLGELAQLARAPALHAGGHRFESDILHNGLNKDCFKVILFGLILGYIFSI